MPIASTPLQYAQTVVTYAALGAAWNLSNYSLKELQSRNGEGYIAHQGVQAVALGAVAGALVAVWGEPADAGSFEVAMGAAIPIFDKVANAFRTGREAYDESVEETGTEERVDDVAAGIDAAIGTLDYGDFVETERAIRGPPDYEPQDPDDEPLTLEEAARTQSEPNADESTDDEDYAGEDGGP